MNLDEEFDKMFEDINAANDEFITSYFDDDNFEVDKFKESLMEDEEEQEEVQEVTEPSEEVEEKVEESMPEEKEEIEEVGEEVSIENVETESPIPTDEVEPSVEEPKKTFSYNKILDRLDRKPTYNLNKINDIMQLIDSSNNTEDLFEKLESAKYDKN